MPSWSCGIAREDCEDLLAADAVIIFTEIPNTILATGGRHVEFGLEISRDRSMRLGLMVLREFIRTIYHEVQIHESEIGRAHV